MRTKTIPDAVRWAIKEGKVHVQSHSSHLSYITLRPMATWWVDRSDNRVGRFQSTGYWLNEDGLYVVERGHHPLDATVYLYPYAENVDEIAKLWERILFR